MVVGAAQARLVLHKDSITNNALEWTSLMGSARTYPESHRPGQPRIAHILHFRGEQPARMDTISPRWLDRRVDALYPLALAVLSVGVALLEWRWPWRQDQPQMRRRLWSDLVHLVFNGHYLGVWVYAIYARWLHQPVTQAVEALGLSGVLFANAAATWPTALQIVVALFVIDFLQWGVHNLLHRVPALWTFHKIHHSVVDGEMDWIVSFRFHWMEVVIYKSCLYIPLAFFGFGPAAIMTHAILGTLIGHLNHANLNWDYGPLKVLLNNPRMHLWHHDRNLELGRTVNFGIIFSCWDYLFGTAQVPDRPPKSIGFEGDHVVPQTFFGHAFWPFAARRSPPDMLSPPDVFSPPGPSRPGLHRGE